MALLGGMGTFFGPFVGAGVFLLLENLVSLWTVHWQLVVGAVFIVCVLFFPRGIWGTLLHGSATAARMSDRASCRPTASARSFGKFVALRDVSARFRQGAAHLASSAPTAPARAPISTAVRRLPAHHRPHRVRRARHHRHAAAPLRPHGHRQIVPDHHRVPPAHRARRTSASALQALVSRFDMWRPRARLPGLVEQADALLRQRRAVAAARRAGRRRWRTASSARWRSRMALASRPRLLLLDEPTAGMSPEETRAMMELIVQARARERTVILVEHKMKLVMGISDRLLVLHHGELLAEGTPGGDPAERDGEAGLSRPAGALTDAATCDEPQRLVWRAATSCRASTSRWRGRDRLPDRPQRRRQDHDPAVGDGPARPHPRLGRVRGQATCSARPAHVRNALGLGYVPEERRIVAGAFGAGKSPARPAGVRRRAGRSGGDRRGRQDVSAPGRAAGPGRRSPCPAASSRCWRSRAP